MATTLYEKLWQRHVVDDTPGETPLLYVDRHLIHEVTSPQAFANLRFTVAHYVVQTKPSL